MPHLHRRMIQMLIPGAPTFNWTGFHNNCIAISSNITVRGENDEIVAGYCLGVKSSFILRSVLHRGCLLIYRDNLVHVKFSLLQLSQTVKKHLYIFTMRLSVNECVLSMKVKWWNVAACVKISVIWVLSWLNFLLQSPGHCSHSRLLVGGLPADRAHPEIDRQGWTLFKITNDEVSGKEGRGGRGASEGLYKTHFQMSMRV